MRTIDIQITKAKLMQFTANFNEDDTLDLSATLGLMTEAGQQISTYSLNTRTYYENKFNLPLNVIEPIFEIAKEIENVATNQCKNHHLQLPEPNL